MKELLTCVLATLWVMEIIWLRGRRRHPYERPDNIDREFRDLVDRAHHKATAVPWYERGNEDAPRLPFPRAHDEHGIFAYDPKIIAEANRAHTTGRLRCPIHGSPCGRAKKAREIGLSQTDEDVGRRAALSNGASTH